MSRLNKKDLIQASGLLDLVQSSNIKNYSSLTEKDFTKMMRTLELNETEQPRDKSGKFIKGPRVHKRIEYYIPVTKEAYDEIYRQLEIEANILWK